MKAALSTVSLTMAVVSKCREDIQNLLQSGFHEEDLDRPRVITIPYIGDAMVKLEVPGRTIGGPLPKGRPGTV